MLVTNRVARWVVSLASRFTPGTDAVTIWPFIFVYPPEFKFDEKLVKHETKHLEQWIRYGIVGFVPLYVWYHYTHGYKNNPLEMEARQAEV